MALALLPFGLMLYILRYLLPYNTQLPTAVPGQSAIKTPFEQGFSLAANQRKKG